MDQQTQKELLRLVARNYELVASDFNASRNKYLWPELIKLAQAVADGQSVLDVGCGNGRLAKAFELKTVKYLGIDNCEQLLALARAHHQECGFKPGNILELGKIPELNFDFVFCIAVLHHLPGANFRLLALQQLKNKVKPGGKLVVIVWNLWPHKKYLKLIFKFWLLRLIKKNKMDFGDLKFDWKNSAGVRVSERYYHAFRRRELKKLIKQAGLRVEKLYKDKYNYYAILKK